MAEREEALRKLEDAVDIMTDMSTIKRNQHTKENEGKFELSPAVVKEAIEAYNLFDRDSRGIDIDELANVFRAVGQNPTDAELRQIMRTHDLNRSGRLTQEEFEAMIISYMKPMWQVKQELKDAFRLFDRDGNGLIDTTELELVLKQFGEPLSHRQSKELIDLMDTNKDGRVDLDDFVKFLCEVDEPDYFKKHYPDRRKGQSSYSNREGQKVAKGHGSGGEGQCQTGNDERSPSADAAGRVKGHVDEVKGGGHMTQNGNGNDESVRGIPNDESDIRKGSPDDHEEIKTGGHKGHNGRRDAQVVTKKGVKS